MPFLAACPFCRRKVQAPDTALGQSIACKKCHNYFTLAPEDDVPPPEATARTAQEYLIAAKANAMAPPPQGPPAAQPAAPAAAQSTMPPTPAAPVAAQVDTVQHVAMTTMPEMPRFRQTALPPLDAEPAASDDMNPLLLAPVVLGVVALLFAAMNWLSWLMIPLAGVGILTGVVAWLTVPIESHRDGVLVLLGSAISAVAFIWGLV